MNRIIHDAAKRKDGKMSILVVGSVAYDTVETPFGRADDALGGAAVYFSAAASFFASVNLVGVVGEDFKMAHLDFLRDKNVDLRGLEVKPGKTFRWGGTYHDDMNSRDTNFTHLNVFEDFYPRIPDSYKDSDYIFLANIVPELQMEVLKQVNSPKLVALDTMNFWIDGSLDALKQVLKQVDILMVNDSETNQLAEEVNLVKAARKILTMGPRILIIKKGEHGAMLVMDGAFFWAPAFPLETIYDPTGAGDTFAGGFMGFLAQCGELSFENLKQAVIYGSSLASFCVEKFSMDRLKELTQDEIRARYREFWKMTNFTNADG